MKVFMITGICESERQPEVCGLYVDGGAALEAADYVSGVGFFDLVVVQEWETDTQVNESVIELQNPTEFCRDPAFLDNRARQWKSAYRQVYGETWEEEMSLRCPDDYTRLVQIGDDDD